MSVAYCSYKRSRPMTEAQAKAIAQRTHLFGYKPDAYAYKGQWFLTIRGDGADDAAIDREIARLNAGA